MNPKYVLGTKIGAHLMVPIQSASNSLFYEYKFAENSPATINNESLIIIGNCSTIKVEVMIVLS